MKKSNFANAKVKLGNPDLILNKSGSRGDAVDFRFKRPGFVNLISHGYDSFPLIFPQISLKKVTLLRRNKKH